MSGIATLQSAATLFSSANPMQLWWKPSRGEAIARLRANGLGLLTLAVLTHLLPGPSPWTAIYVSLRRTPASTLYYYYCVFEFALFALLGLNVLQSSYALKYPRVVKVSPRLLSPAKTLQTSPPPQQWRLSSITPNLGPQRPFAYASSPISTPSRTLSYTLPQSTSGLFDSSFASSRASLPGTPVSPLAAYRGRHSLSAGHAFHGSILNRLAQANSDDDDDE